MTRSMIHTRVAKRETKNGGGLINKLDGSCEEYTSSMT